MKNIVCIMCMHLFMLADAQGSRQDNIGKYFGFSQNISLITCDGVGGNPRSAIIIPQGKRFIIKGIINQDYIIQVLEDGSDVSFNQVYYNSGYNKAAGVIIRPAASYIYFLLPMADFELKTEVIIPTCGFTLGTMVLPIKMRFGSNEKVDGVYNKDFLIANDVSLGFNFGLKYRLSQNLYINGLLGVGISTILVDSSTTKGYFKSATNTSGLSTHAGLLFEIENFQIGVFGGFDFLTGAVQKSWIYSGDPWMGIGIGYSLFKKKNTSDSQ